MDDVHGRFVFDNGMVTMQRRELPVPRRAGDVLPRDGLRRRHAAGSTWPSTSSGQGHPARSRSAQEDAPLDGAVRPRLDDGHTFRARGDLQIGWSGEPGEPAWCQWENMLVVFNDNTVKTGIPLEHIQGELEQVERLVQRPGA